MKFLVGDWVKHADGGGCRQVKEVRGNMLVVAGFTSHESAFSSCCPDCEADLTGKLPHVACPERLRRKLVQLGDAFVDSKEVIAIVFGPLQSGDCCSLLLRNGPPISVNLSGPDAAKALGLAP